jgi:hypothetical protein
MRTMYISAMRPAKVDDSWSFVDSYLEGWLANYDLKVSTYGVGFYRGDKEPSRKVLYMGAVADSVPSELAGILKQDSVLTVDTGRSAEHNAMVLTASLELEPDDGIENGFLQGRNVDVVCFGMAEVTAALTTLARYRIVKAELQRVHAEFHYPDGSEK